MTFGISKTWYGTDYDTYNPTGVSGSNNYYQDFNEIFKLAAVPTVPYNNDIWREIGSFEISGDNLSIVSGSEKLSVSKNGVLITMADLINAGINMKLVNFTPTQALIKTYKIIVDEPSILAMKNFIDGGETLKIRMDFKYKEGPSPQQEQNYAGESILLGVNEAAVFSDIKNHFGASDDSLYINEVDIPSGSGFDLFKFKLTDDTAIDTNTIINTVFVVDENNNLIPYLEYGTDYEVEYSAGKYSLKLTASGVKNIRDNANSGPDLKLKFTVVTEDKGDAVGPVGTNTKVSEHSFNVTVNGITQPIVIAPADVTINETNLSSGVDFAVLAKFELIDGFNSPFNNSFNLVLNIPASTAVTGGTGSFILTKGTHYEITQSYDSVANKHYAIFKLTEAGELAVRNHVSNTTSDLKFDLSLTVTDPVSGEVSNLGKTTVTINGMADIGTTAHLTPGVGGDTISPNSFTSGTTTFLESELSFVPVFGQNYFELASVDVTDTDKIQKVDNFSLSITGNGFGISLNSNDYVIIDGTWGGNFYAPGHETAKVTFGLTQSGIDKIKALNTNQTLNLEAKFDVKDYNYNGVGNAGKKSYSHTFKIVGDTTVDLIGDQNFEVFENAIPANGLVWEGAVNGVFNDIIINNVTVANSDSEDVIDASFFTIAKVQNTNKVRVYVKLDRIQELKDILDSNGIDFDPSNNDFSTLKFDIIAVNTANPLLSKAFNIEGKFIGSEDSVSAVMNLSDFNAAPVFDLEVNENPVGTPLVINMDQFINDSEFGNGSVDMRIFDPGSISSPVVVVTREDGTVVNVPAGNIQFNNFGNDITIHGLPDLADATQFYKIKINYNAISLHDDDKVSGQVYVKVKGFNGVPPVVIDPVDPVTGLVTITEIESTPADPNSPTNAFDLGIDAKTWAVLNGTVVGAPSIIAISSTDTTENTAWSNNVNLANFIKGLITVSKTANSVSIKIGANDAKTLSQIVDDNDDITFTLKFDVDTNGQTTTFTKDFTVKGVFNSLKDYDNTLLDAVQTGVVDSTVTQGVDSVVTLNFASDTEFGSGGVVTYGNFDFFYTKVDAAGNNTPFVPLVVTPADYSYDAVTKKLTFHTNVLATLPKIFSGEHYLIEVHAKGTSSYDGDTQDISYVIRVDGEGNDAIITVDPTIPLTYNEDALDVSGQVIGIIEVFDNNFASTAVDITVDVITSNAKDDAKQTLTLSANHYTISKIPASNTEELIEILLTAEGVDFLNRNLSAGEHFNFNVKVTATDTLGQTKDQTLNFVINGANDAPFANDNLSAQDTFLWSGVTEGYSATDTSNYLVSLNFKDYDDNWDPANNINSPATFNGATKIEAFVTVPANADGNIIGNFGLNNYFTITPIKKSDQGGVDNNFDEYDYVITFKTGGKQAFENKYGQNAVVKFILTATDANPTNAPQSYEKIVTFTDVVNADPEFQEIINSNDSDGNLTDTSFTINESQVVFGDQNNVLFSVKLTDDAPIDFSNTGPGNNLSSTLVPDPILGKVIVFNYTDINGNPAQLILDKGLLDFGMGAQGSGNDGFITFWINASATAKIDAFKANLPAGQVATATFSLTYTDAGGNVDTQAYTININGEGVITNAMPTFIEAVYNQINLLLGTDADPDLFTINLEESDLSLFQNGPVKTAEFFKYTMHDTDQAFAPANVILPATIEFRDLNGNLLLTLDGNPNNPDYQSFVSTNNGAGTHFAENRVLLTEAGYNKIHNTIGNTPATATIHLSYTDTGTPAQTATQDLIFNLNQAVNPIPDFKEITNLNDSDGNLVDASITINESQVVLGGSSKFFQVRLTDDAPIFNQQDVHISTPGLGEVIKFDYTDINGNPATLILDRATDLGFAVTNWGTTELLLDFSIASNLATSNKIADFKAKLAPGHLATATFDMTYTDVDGHPATKTYTIKINGDDLAPTILEATRIGDDNPDNFIIQVDENEFTLPADDWLKSKLYQFTIQDDALITHNSITYPSTIEFKDPNTQAVLITLQENVHFTRQAYVDTSGGGNFTTTVNLHLTDVGYNLIHNTIGTSPATATFTISYNDGTNATVSKDVVFNINSAVAPNDAAFDISTPLVYAEDALLTAGQDIAKIKITDAQFSSVTTTLTVDSTNATSDSGQPITLTSGTHYTLTDPTVNGGEVILNLTAAGVAYLDEQLTTTENLKFKLSVKATDSNNQTKTVDYTITVNGANDKAVVADMNPALNAFNVDTMLATDVFASFSVKDFDNNFDPLAGVTPQTGSNSFKVTGTVDGVANAITFDNLGNGKVNGVTYFKLTQLRDNNVNGNGNNLDNFDKFKYEIKFVDANAKAAFKNAFMADHLAEVKFTVEATDAASLTTSITNIKTVTFTDTPNAAPQIIDISAPAGTYDAATNTIDLNEADLAVNSQLLKFKITDDANIDIPSINDGVEIKFTINGVDLILTQGAAAGQGDYYATITQVVNNQTQELVYKLTAQGLGKITTAAGLDNGVTATSMLTVTYTDGTNPITKTFNFNLHGESNQNIDVTNLNATAGLNANQLTDQTIIGSFSVTDDNAIAQSQLKPKLVISDGTHDITLNDPNFFTLVPNGAGSYQIKISQAGLDSINAGLANFNHGALTAVLTVNATAAVNEVDSEVVNFAMNYPQAQAPVLTDFSTANLLFKEVAANELDSTDVVAKFRVADSDNPNPNQTYNYDLDPAGGIDKDFDITLKMKTGNNPFSDVAGQTDDWFTVTKVGADYLVRLSDAAVLSLKNTNTGTSEFQFEITARDQVDTNVNSDPLATAIWKLEDDNIDLQLDFNEKFDTTESHLNAAGVATTFVIGKFTATDNLPLTDGNFTVSITDGTYTLSEVMGTNTGTGATNYFNVTRIGATDQYEVKLTQAGYNALKTNSFGTVEPNTVKDYDITITATNNQTPAETDSITFEWKLTDDSVPQGWVTTVDINDHIDLSQILSNPNTQVFHFAHFKYDVPNSAAIPKINGYAEVTVVDGTVDPGCVPNNQSFISSFNEYTGDVADATFMLSRLGMQQIYDAMAANPGQDHLTLSVELNLYTGGDKNDPNAPRDTFNFEFTVYE